VTLYSGPTFILAKTAGYDTIPLLASDEFIDNTPTTGFHVIPNFGNNFIASGPSTGTFSTAFAATYSNGGSVGILAPSTAGIKQRIMFYARASAAQICPSKYPFCAAGQAPEIYLKLVYNNAALKITDSAAGIEHNIPCTTTNCADYGTKSPVLTNTIKSSSAYAYTVFKCSGSYATCANMLPGSTIGFGLQDVQLGDGSQQFFPTPYPSDSTLDFIIAFQAGPPGSLPANAQRTSFMVINGYVISSSRATSLQAALVNYYRFGSTINNGLTIPVMLRIAGSFTSSELGAAGGQHLAVFVDGLVDRFFAASDDATACNDGLTCVWAGNDGQPLGYVDDWTSQRYLLVKDLISARNTAKFQVLAPLLTTLVNGKSLHVAILRTNDNTNNYQVLNVIRVYGGALQQADMSL
jgi:hypothetical protein